MPRIDRESEPARRGTLLHRFVMEVKDLGYDEALVNVPEDFRSTAAQYDLRGLPDDPAAYASEIAFAIDMRTGEARELGRDIERKYAEHGATEHDVVGAADFVALLGAERIGIDDLKSGWSAVTAAKDNLQVGGLAYAGARKFNRTGARVRLLVRRENGSGYFDRADLDDFDLDNVFERLRRAADGVRRAREDVAAGRQPELREGPHCTYCPAFDGCPAKTNLIRALVRSPGDVLVADHTREAFLALQTIGSAYHAVKARMQDFVREHGPIDLGDGTVWGYHVTERPIVDAVIARRELSAYGPEVAEKACKFTTSKSAIYEALRPVAPERGLTKLNKAVLERIAVEGGITKKRTEACEVFTPDAAELEED